MAEEENENETEKKQGLSLFVKILLFGVLPLLLIVIIVFGTLFVAGVIPGEHGDTAAVEASADATEEDMAADDGEEEEQAAAIYLPIEPAFVVNFASQGKARFLQVTVEVMTRDPAVPEKVQLHMPVIRNNLMLLFSDQVYDDVSTLEGKESLREEALATIQAILEEETGDPGVEQVYFTSFVMQ
jgi:flagellar FliL protein